MKLDRRELDELASIHLASLPDSLVTILGRSYARAFYSYLGGSRRELLILERDGSGILGACVTSLEASTLNRRLLLATPLLPWALVRFWRVASRLLRGLSGGDAETVPQADLPELILIFSRPESRSRGVGGRLVSRLEAELRSRGVWEYQARTEADPSNRALTFYRRLGFQEAGVGARYGTRFQLFTKSLPVS